MTDERAVDAVRQDDSVQTFLLEHVDVLALFFLIGYIEDGVLMLLFVLLQAVL